MLWKDPTLDGSISTSTWSSQYWVPWWVLYSSTTSSADAFPRKSPRRDIMYSDYIAGIQTIFNFSVAMLKFINGKESDLTGKVLLFVSTNHNFSQPFPSVGWEHLCLTCSSAITSLRESATLRPSTLNRVWGCCQIALLKKHSGSLRRSI